jgi:hypothetical protein
MNRDNNKIISYVTKTNTKNNITLGQLYYLYYLKKYLKIQKNNPSFSYNESYAYDIANKYFYNKFGKEFSDENRNSIRNKLDLDIDHIPDLKKAIERYTNSRNNYSRYLQNLIPRQFRKNKSVGPKFNPENGQPYIRTPTELEMKRNFEKNLRKYVVKKEMMKVIQDRKSVKQNNVPSVQSRKNNVPTSYAQQTIFMTKPYGLNTKKSKSRILKAHNSSLEKTKNSTRNSTPRAGDKYNERKSSFSQQKSENLQCAGCFSGLFNFQKENDTALSNFSDFKVDDSRPPSARSQFLKRNTRIAPEPSHQSHSQPSTSSKKKSSRLHVLRKYQTSPELSASEPFENPSHHSHSQPSSSSKKKSSRLHVLRTYPQNNPQNNPRKPKTAFE